MAFLDTTGLEQVWGIIKTKVNNLEINLDDHTHKYAGSSSVGGSATSAVKLDTARTIDGVSFDGSANITHYGICSTAAATATKTVSLTGFTLATGAKVAIKFTVTNTASNPTLNVNSTGAKAIYYRGSAISAGYLAANRVYQFVYDGTNYELIGDINTNTDTKVTQTVTTSNANYPILLAPSGQTTNTTTISYFDSGVTLNPSTGTIAANISGTAAKATQDANGNEITSTYLPLSGGTLTGNLTTKTLTISGTEAGLTHIKFSRPDVNYIVFPNNGAISFECGDTATSAGNGSLVIRADSVHPGKTDISLGTNGNKWANVYATTFTGALSGNATSAGKVNSNLIIKLNGGSTEETNLFTFNGSAAKTVNITASSIGAAASSHTHSYLPLGGGTMTGKITGVDTQTTWIGTTRNGAFRVETAASGTKAVSALSMKTSSGAWSIANLADDDSLYFTYGTDTSYNANANTVNKYSISTDGAWSGSATKLTTARTLTIGGTGKTFDGSANVSWDLNEIGAYGLANRGTAITSNSDLDEYLTAGNYYVPDSTTAKTITNTPFTGNGYRLICQTGYGSGNNVYSYGYQIAFGSSNNIKFRICNSGAWTSWTSYSKEGHTHSYLPLNGGTLTGTVVIKNAASSGITIRPTTSTSGVGSQIIQDTGSTTEYAKNRFTFRVYSPKTDAPTQTNSYYENYSLPSCNFDRTSYASYDILTTKNVVTVPQGGTGAINASGARTNLGITSGTSLDNVPSSPSEGDIFFLY